MDAATTTALASRLNDETYPEFYEHPGELIEEHDPDADRRAAQEIIAMLTEAYGL
ncbi:hypothetical protein [Nonomuraea sp. MG754425]|uniref:hypothetical protein n=1 Tax=Nonomuraea sp. MG754425 TaxID=2570319 RepID=UPI001F397518|nr:hypothetical protein [Nonomuraea sp. MG754425]